MDSGKETRLNDKQRFYIYNHNVIFSIYYQDIYLKYHRYDQYWYIATPLVSYKILPISSIAQSPELTNSCAG